MHQLAFGSLRGCFSHISCLCSLPRAGAASFHIAGLAPSDATRHRLKEDRGEEQKGWGMGLPAFCVDGVQSQS